MISIDNEGDVSIIENGQLEQPLEDIENKKQDYIEVELWQWVIIIFGIIFFFLLLNASFSNYQY